MIINGKNVCDGSTQNPNCRSCFTCGNPRKILIKNNIKKELCNRCYNQESQN